MPAPTRPQRHKLDGRTLLVRCRLDRVHHGVHGLAAKPPVALCVDQELGARARPRPRPLQLCQMLGERLPGSMEHLLESGALGFAARKIREGHQPLPMRESAKKTDKAIAPRSFLRGLKFARPSPGRRRDNFPQRQNQLRRSVHAGRRSAKDNTAASAPTSHASSGSQPACAWAEWLTRPAACRSRTGLPRPGFKRMPAPVSSGYLGLTGLMSLGTRRRSKPMPPATTSFSFSVPALDTDGVFRLIRQA